MRVLLYLQLICYGLIANSDAIADDSCTPSGQTEAVQVRYVHDGDTLFLNDGRKLRLIGLNAPEIKYKDKAAEPLADFARQRLRTVLQSAGNRLLIEYDAEPKDKYGRTLIHAFLPDGRNLTELLIAEGLAISLQIPPNLTHWACYKAAETQARQRKQALWALPSYQTKTMTELPDKANGFFIVRGTIQSIQTKKSAIIKMKYGLELFIHANDMKYFTETLKSLTTGRSITVMGWIHPRKNKLTMRIHHPAVLEY